MSTQELRLTLALAALAWMSLAESAPPPAAARYEPVPGASPEPRPGGADLNDTAAVAKFLDGLLKAQYEQGEFVGAAAAAVKDGKIIFKDAYGYADVDRKIPVSADETLFRLGSISKAFTATAVLQGVDQGVLRLDDDVNAYLGGKLVPDHDGPPVTLRNLLTHTPGLEDNKHAWMLAGSDTELTSLSEALASHVPQRVHPATTNFSDGRHAGYANWGAALAGHVVATVARMPYDEYVEQHIFRPCGMQRSSFREPLPTHLAPLVATGYREVDGVFQPQPFEYWHDVGPAGSLSSTAADMARFMVGHLQKGACQDGRILEEPTARAMHDRQLSPAPHVNGAGFGFFETYLNGIRLVHHGGQTVNFRSEMWLMPEHGFGLFVAYNNSSGTPLRKFLKEYFPVHVPPLEPPAGFAARAFEYEGVFAPNSRSYSRSERMLWMLAAFTVKAAPEGTLDISSPLGGGISTVAAAKWVQVRGDTFRRVDGQEMITFLRDEAGRAMHIVGPRAFDPASRLAAWEAALYGVVQLGIGIREAVRQTMRDYRLPLRPWVLMALVMAGCVFAAAGAAPRLVSGAGGRAARSAIALVAITDFALLVVVASTVSAYVDDFPRFLLDLPWHLHALSWLSLASLVLTGVVLYWAVRGWREPDWTWLGRLEYSALALLALAVLIWFWRWNLVGYDHA